MDKFVYTLYEATFGEPVPIAPGECFSDEEIANAILTGKRLKFKNIGKPIRIPRVKKTTSSKKKTKKEAESK